MDNTHQKERTKSTETRFLCLKTNLKELSSKIEYVGSEERFKSNDGLPRAIPGELLQIEISGSLVYESNPGILCMITGELTDMILDFRSAKPKIISRPDLNCDSFFFNEDYLSVEFSASVIKYDILFEEKLKFYINLKENETRGYLAWLKTNITNFECVHIFDLSLEPTWG